MRQRVMVAMGLLSEPDLLIADEPTAALDVTVQGQIIHLMSALQKKSNTAIILITHDLGAVAGLCDRVLVMYAGEAVECGTAEDIFYRPQHPYTKGLLSSIPRLDHPRKTRLPIIEGMVPGLLDLPPGCRFQNRCPYREEACAVSPPVPEPVDASHEVACFRWKEIQSAS